MIPPQLHLEASKGFPISGPASDLEKQTPPFNKAEVVHVDVTV